MRAGLVDGNRLVDRRVHHEQGGTEMLQRLRGGLGDVVEELLLLIVNGATGEEDLGLAFALDRLDARAELRGHVAGVGRGADRRDRADAGELARGGEHGGAAEAVADEQRRRATQLLEVGGGGEQVLHVRGEVVCWRSRRRCCRDR